MGQCILGFLWSDLFLITLHGISIVSWPLICRTVCEHLQRKCWWVELKFDGKTHYGPPHTWYTFDHASLNSPPFLSSDKLSSFRSSADRYFIRLSSNLVGQRIMWLPLPGKLLVMLHWISIVSWHLIGWAVSEQLMKNCWWEWAQMWCVSSLLGASSLIILWSLSS